MPKRIVTMHELETTKWTVDLLSEATSDEIQSIRSHIASECNSSPAREVYDRFLMKLVENAKSIRTEAR
jgi:hypothetical protein